MKQLLWVEFIPDVSIFDWPIAHPSDQNNVDGECAIQNQDADTETVKHSNMGAFDL
ncbi:MAG: hypothetical protein JNJ49_07995 [Bdellovibrionaceae bacterium]|nr:hypothetical protein [Pseudobdellovibrionaceae bacterium]